ncbi:hypothetical protein BA939_07245 [Rhizobium sp. S41]|nr:hypothetical protein BA939_07245 [Rhizobium sp. S41]KGE79897.1 hypothetical protein LW14_26350 [Rhizobium sp. H41]
MGRRLKNRPLVVGQNGQPRLQVRSVIRTRLELRCDAEVRAEEAAAKFDQFLESVFPGAEGAGEIPVQTGRMASGMPVMPISA